MNGTNLIELKNKIVQANKLYRNGNPIISDQEFDDLVEQFQSLVSNKEYDEFRNSLHEEKGKVKHPFVMGSLDKLKIEEPESIIKFFKTISCPVNISAKVDGISCRIQYKNGSLVSASTRGDGTFGEDLTSKIKWVKNVPMMLRGSLKDANDIHVRGELVILKDDFASMDGFANPRNACAGIMNRKDATKEDINNVSFIAYTILGSDFTKAEQFDKLDESGFVTAWHENITDISYGTLVDNLYEKANVSFDYETDGLVVCSSSYKNEAKYRPDECKAVKTNQMVGTTKLIDVSFEGPSKDGFMIPVAVLEPVSLGGAMISRAALHNLDFINEEGIKYGSTVKVLKSGDIIPKIVEVVSNDGASDIVYPTECPCCGEKLVRDGINLRCTNKACKDQTTYQVMHFIRKLGVESVSFKTLQRLNIFTYSDLLMFSPGKMKTDMKLANELKDKVFTRSKKELLAALNFRGLSETLINQVTSFYGIDTVLNEGPFIGLPKGVGDITMQKFIDALKENLATMNKIVSDVRYSYSQNESRGHESQKKTNGMSVCFTGALTISRSTASKMAEDAGFEVKGGVTKGLTYLVTNTPDSGSSKNKKAKSLGTKIIDEREFMQLINSSTLEGNVDDL